LKYFEENNAPTSLLLDLLNIINAMKIWGEVIE